MAWIPRESRQRILKASRAVVVQYLRLKNSAVQMSIIEPTENFQYLPGKRSRRRRRRRRRRRKRREREREKKKKKGTNRNYNRRKSGGRGSEERKRVNKTGTRPK